MKVEAGKYFCYSCSPIDRWDGWLPVSEAVASASEDPASLVARLGERLKGDLGWEGDGTWMIAPLPNPESQDSVFMYAVKQGNNGTTFICSPFPLPWLDDRFCDWKEIRI